MEASLRLIEKNIQKKREMIRIRIQNAVYSMVVENDVCAETRTLIRSVDNELNDILE